MPKTAYEKASEALAAAEKKVARLTTKRDKAKAESEAAGLALSVAEWEVNNLKTHPALQNPPAADGNASPTPEPEDIDVTPAPEPVSGDVVASSEGPQAPVAVPAQPAAPAPVDDPFAS